MPETRWQRVHGDPEAEELLRRDIENIGKFFSNQGANVNIEKAFKEVLEA